MDRGNNPDIEDETHDLPVGVSIKNLCKVFKVCTFNLCMIICFPVLIIMTNFILCVFEPHTF